MKILTFALLCCFLISCKDEKVETIADNTDAVKIIQLVNNVRKTGCKCGEDQMPAVGNLTWNTQLLKAAEKHSIDMNTNNFFSHTGSDGSDAGQRITNAGYKWTMYGENIGKGYVTEEEVINGWLTSGAHCKNIMNKDFTDFAVSKSGQYWTMDLGKK